VSGRSRDQRVRIRTVTMPRLLKALASLISVAWPQAPATKIAAGGVIVRELRLGACLRERAQSGPDTSGRRSTPSWRRGRGRS
jgi:hypothetical protein